MSALFSTCQHGFQPEHSCVTQLLNVMEDWTAIMESGGPVDVIYLNFKKALIEYLITGWHLSGSVMVWEES